MNEQSERRPVGPGSQSFQVFRLQPEWQHYFFPIIISILLIPVFLIGIFLLIYFMGKLRNTRYEISNDWIARRDKDEKIELRLADIQHLRLTRNFMHERFGLGNVHIHGHHSEIVLEGVKEPGQLMDLIRVAADQEKHTARLVLHPKDDFDYLKTGAAEQMNNLVGLWQQGLISNEDYETEKQKFVKSGR